MGALEFTKLKNFSQLKTDVIPAIVQDKATGRVLILGYMNEAALKATQTSGRVVFYSTSREELWEKGATSGDYLYVEDIWVNCEDNSLLIQVKMASDGACHKKDENGKAYPTCFYRRLNDAGN